MKSKLQLLNTVLIVFLGTLLLSSCEDDPKATLVIENHDKIEYSVYFGETLLGTVSPLGKASFEVSGEDCGDIKLKGDEESDPDFHCFTEDETYTISVDLRPTQIKFINNDWCGYDCYFGGEYIGYVSSLDTEKSFKVAPGTGDIEVKSSGCDVNGSIENVTLEEDDTYEATIDLEKKKVFEITKVQN